MHSRRKHDCEVLVNVEDGHKRSYKNANERGVVLWLIDSVGVIPLISCMIFLGSLIAVALCVPLIGHAMGKAGRGRYSYLSLNSSENITKPIEGQIVNVTGSHHYNITRGQPATLTTQEPKSSANLSTVFTIDLDKNAAVESLEKLTVVVKDADNVERPLDHLTDLEESDITHLGANVTTVGFLLPLRGSHHLSGFKFGRPLKTEISKIDGRNGTNIQILVRDTQADSNLAKSLTKHFYDSHGTRVFFGYITDDEALSVSAWGRSNAPGAKFISPTATTHLLENSVNFLSVQPDSKYLVAALADFLSLTSISKEIIIVTPASITKDTFIDKLKMHKVKPFKVVYYYHWNDMKSVIANLKPQIAKCPNCVLMLLGDQDSCLDLIKQCDIIFSIKPTWVLPYTSQLFIIPESLGSSIVSIQYRPYDYHGNEFLKADKMLNTLNATVNSSLHLILGGKKYWKGSYVVSLYASSTPKPNSFLPMPQDDGGLPMMEYEIDDSGITRTYYEHLALTTVALQNLTYTQNEKCELIIRYLEELSGDIKVHKVHPTAAILVPVTKGAQIHLDCPNQHLDIKCHKSDSNKALVTCQGNLYGSHNFSPVCGTEVDVTLETFKGCSISNIKGCDGKSKQLMCRIFNFCSSNLGTKGKVTCNGVMVRELQ